MFASVVPLLLLWAAAPSSALDVVVSPPVAPLSPLAPLPPVAPLPGLLFSTPFTYPRLHLQPAVTLFPEKGPLVSPIRTRPSATVLEPATYSSRLALRTLDMCYFLGQDIFNSHVACNQNWADGTAEGVRSYINELTFETNKLLGSNNLRLAWKGPFERHDAAERYPTDPARDAVTASQLKCDLVVFLVFNEFAKDCKTATYGHQYGGVAQGGMCEAGQGSGYSIIVDQGFLEDAWTGPQILGHHILKMLIADLPVNERTCPNKDSLLYPQLYPGKQRVDQCVVEKLNKSQISLRPCMQD